MKTAKSHFASTFQLSKVRSAVKLQSRQRFLREFIFIFVLAGFFSSSVIADNRKALGTAVQLPPDGRCQIIGSSTLPSPDGSCSITMELFLCDGPEPLTCCTAIVCPTGSGFSMSLNCVSD